MYVLVKDDRKSGRWFVIPEEKREEFDKWGRINYNDPPDWAQLVTSPTNIKFFGWYHE